MTRLTATMVLVVFALGCAGAPPGPSPFAPVSGPAHQSAGSRVLVTVNGEGITAGALVDLLVARSGRAALDWLIVERLITQEARRIGIVLTAEDVEKEIAREVAQQGGWDNVRAHLEAAGWTESQFKEAARTQALIFKILEKQGKLKLTEAELKQLHQSLYGRKAIVQMIVVDNLKQARTIRERLDKGESFELLARVFSRDESSQAGGNLGPVARGELLPELDAAIFAVKPGKLSPIVSSPLGFHIFKLIDYTDPRPVDYEKVKSQVQAQLLNRKFQFGRETLLTQLRRQAQIVPADPYTTLQEVLKY